jgi:metal-responsive CopG/Arc/MetJ family transcriptional regulator
MDRIIISMEKDQIQAIDAMASAENISRAEFIRRKLQIECENTSESDLKGSEFFGIAKEKNWWNGDNAIDYQHHIRSEWNDE